MSDQAASIMSEYMNRAALARMLNKSERTLYRWDVLGEGPTQTLVGKTVLYHVDDVKAWLRSQRREVR